MILPLQSCMFTVLSVYKLHVPYFTCKSYCDLKNTSTGPLGKCTMKCILFCTILGISTFKKDLEHVSDNNRNLYFYSAACFFARCYACISCHNELLYPLCSRLFLMCDFFRNCLKKWMKLRWRRKISKRNLKNNLFLLKTSMRFVFRSGNKIFFTFPNSTVTTR